MGIFVILELAGWAKRGNMYFVGNTANGESVGSFCFLWKLLGTFFIWNSTTHVIRNTTKQCIYFEILLSQAFLQKFRQINFVVQIHMDLD